MKTRADQVHSLLHCHFESALRALAVTRPGELKRLRPVVDSSGYARATPATRLSMLDAQVGSLAHGQDIFTRDVFAEVVRRLAGEMTGSGISHVDLRVGVLMHHWPWIGSLTEAIGAFDGEMPGPETLTISFLGAVNLSRPCACWTRSSPATPERFGCRCWKAWTSTSTSPDLATLPGSAA